MIVSVQLVSELYKVINFHDSKDKKAQRIQKRALRLCLLYFLFYFFDVTDI